MKYTKKHAMDDAFEYGRNHGRRRDSIFETLSRFSMHSRCGHAAYRGWKFGHRERRALIVMAGRELTQPEIEAAFKTMEAR